VKIKPSDLHFSQPVLDEFENLRELMLQYFAFEKFYNDRKEELEDVKEQKKELDTLQMMYEKSSQHLKIKNQIMETERQRV
jgi:hypothetical protein